MLNGNYKFKFTLLLGLLILLSGCSLKEYPEAAKAPSRPTGQLVVASSLELETTRSLAQDFANRTGIQVQLEPLPPEQLPQRLERLKHTKYDLWLGGTPEEYFLAAGAGLLANYQAGDQWKLPWQMTDRQGRWTPLYTDRLAVLGNRDKLSRLGITAPLTWEQLLQPVLHKEIILERPDNGGATFAMITSLWQLRGQDAALAYAGRLRTQAPQYASDLPEAVKLVASGQKAVTVLPLSYALDLQDEDTNLQAEELQDSNADLLRGVAVLKAGTDQREAQAFIDYLLSPEGTALLQDLDPYKQYLIGAANRKETIREGQELPNNDLGWMARERQAIITAWLNAY